MKLSPSRFSHHNQEGEKTCLNSELWHACAGPLVSLPAVLSRVIYFPQGHSEQVAVSTNKEIDAHIPNYPSLPPQLICQLHNVAMHADVETDEVYAQMTLQPLNPQDQKDVYLLPSELGMPNKQPTNYFCKTLTASDTSTHGGFSVPRRAAEKVFPPLDFNQQPPCQELIARDLHENEWKFRHIFRGQPKRHLLTTGWSVFVSAKRLVAGDSIIFIWNEKSQLLLGIRRANRPQTVMPSSVLSSDSMHIGLLAAAAHAVATNSRFTIFYNPRASPSEFVIPIEKYAKAVYHTRVSVGMRFRMLFETEESSVRRHMGTITGIGDLDNVRWPNSHWRSVKVGWDESTAGERQPRVSLWEIEPLTTIPMYPSPFPLRLKRPWPYGLPPFHALKDGDMSLNSSLTWLQGNVEDQGLQSLNFSGFGVMPLMHPRIDSSMLGLQPDMYHAMEASALQNMRTVDPSNCSPQSFLQLQHPQNVSNGVSSMTQRQILQQSQSQHTLPQSLQQNMSSPQSRDQLIMQQQLQNSHSYNGQQQQFQQSHRAQQLHVPNINSASSQFESVQSQIPSLQAIVSPCQPRIFPESIENSMPSSDMSSMQSLTGSFFQGVTSASHLLPTNDLKSVLASTTLWPKQALTPQVSFETSHCVVPTVEHMGAPQSNISGYSTMLPSFPGREYCAYQDSTDLQNDFIFGVGKDSLSLMLHNGMPNLRSIGNENESFSMPFAASNFASGANADFPLNSDLSTSSSIDETGFLQSSENVDQVHPQTGTFVKVHKSGSLGRSLDISKFSNYRELRSELAHMFGLEGQLEDQRSGWQLVFVDRENDVLLLGDDPWQEFVNSVWYIKILSPLEVHQMRKEGMDVGNSGPTHKLSDQSMHS